MQNLLVPELPVNLKDVVEADQGRNYSRQTAQHHCGAEDAVVLSRLGKQIEKMSRHEIRVTVLGHTQRGGTPTAADRILASRLASKAVEIFINGEANQMVRIQGKEIVRISFPKQW